MRRLGITPHVWSDALVQFYEQTDAFLYELIAWNRNVIKVAIREWINEVLARLPRFALDVLAYGDGIGCDSLYLTQAGHRVTYCDMGQLNVQFAQALFAATGLPFKASPELSKLPKQGYDAIICLDVLEHVPQPTRLVEQLVHCLKPGGLLIVSAPFFMITPEFSTHLKENVRYSGSLRRLYQRQGLQLVDGQPFHYPLVLSKPPITYDAGAGGWWRRMLAHAGGLVLKSARIWSWPHRWIGCTLLRRGYRYWTDGLQPAATPSCQEDV